uniref:Uncharacterized protein n=1 Tax=Rhizophora mucronata TaxID=61149 RepID=A0A2P2PLY5_RHIMU
MILLNSEIIVPGTNIQSDGHLKRFG